MNTEQELRPCPLCNAKIVVEQNVAGRPTIEIAYHPAGDCPIAALVFVATPDRIAAWNRRSSDEQADVAERRDVLFFASYCGGDNPACTPARPCADCIAMGNVYSIPVGTQVLFRREFGASPPAVAVGGVTADTNLRNVVHDLVQNHIDDITPFARAILTAALAVRDEGIREGWQDIATLTPTDNMSVILAVPQRLNVGWIVGEAIWHVDAEDRGDWWWAGTGPGDYYADPISIANFNAPTHWQPLPEAPTTFPTPPSRGEGGMKLLKTRLRCPACKGGNLNLVECGTFTTTFSADAGVFDREYGVHEPESIDRLEAHCRDCGKAWKPRGAQQIDDVAIDPFGRAALKDTTHAE